MLLLKEGGCMGPTSEPFHLPGRVDGRLLVSLSYSGVLLSFVSLKFPLEPPDPDTPHPPPPSSVLFSCG